MATNIIKRNKLILTNPISSKTIYPFVIDKKIKLGKNTTGNLFIEIGRLIRPVQQNVFYEAQITFQVLVPLSPIQQTKLNIKYIAELFKNNSSTGQIREEIVSLEAGTSGIINRIINFNNTNDADEIKISVSAINDTTFTNSNLANYINLVYLEKKEE